MKSTKLLAAVPILALSAAAIFGWSAFSHAETPATSTGKRSNTGARSTSNTEKPVDADRVARMDAAINRIASRLGVAAPMELADPSEEQLLARNLADGTIIEISVEQVEAAVKAAALTPDTDDDVAAGRLKHCGSYRFYAPE